MRCHAPCLRVLASPLPSVTRTASSSRAVGPFRRSAVLRTLASAYSPESAPSSSSDSSGDIVSSPPLPGSFKPPLRRSTTDVSGETCEAAIVSVNNDAHPLQTLISISVKGFPGLLRLITWYLEGLELTIHRAKMRTCPTSGTCDDEFYVTDLKGNKLADTWDVTERLEEYLHYCTPSQDAFQAQVFVQGPIVIDNTRDADYSVLTLNIKKKHNLQMHVLGEVASTLTGLGYVINAADIDGDMILSGSGDTKWEFQIHNLKGDKLGYVEASGLLYTLCKTLDHSSTRLKNMPFSIV